MADLKISQLNAITVLTPATDVLPVVDSGGVTKKITTNQILGSGGTATLASATITGNLTVDTSTLFVDSSANVVGIGTITPQQNLHVLGTGTTTIAVERSGATIGGRFEFVSGNSTNLVRCVTAKDLVFEQTLGTEVHRIAANGVATWSNVGGVASTAMTLNSTGLGVGGSPSSRLDVANSATPVVFSMTLTGVQRWQQIIDTSAGNWTLRDQTGSIDALIVKAGSGNVGIGVTPSAWGAGYKAIQIASSQSTALMGSGNQTELTTNAFFDSAWKYQGAGTVAASRYSQQSGVHYWYSAAAGAANATITDFATAKMTLDASGNLILLSSNTPATLTTNGQLTVNATSNTNLRFSYRGSDGTTRVANITLA